MVRAACFRITEPYLGRAGAAVAIMVHASMHGEMRYFWIAQPETFQVARVLVSYLLMTRIAHERSPRLRGHLYGVFCEKVRRSAGTGYGDSLGGARSGSASQMCRCGK